MDETPIKAGRAGPGKMKGTYFWPIYGEHDEVCFPHFESRRHEHVEQALGLDAAPGAVLLTDGYAAYERYAQKSGITHAQCWTHSRRTFFEAQDAEPQAAAEALRQIGALYEIEDEIRTAKLSGENKRLHRLTHSKPRVEKFFEWVDRQFERQGLLPSNPLTKALAYVRERRVGLEVFLGDADVPMDTNHIERALRAIPMGRRYAKCAFMRSLARDGRQQPPRPWSVARSARLWTSHKNERLLRWQPTTGARHGRVRIHPPDSGNVAAQQRPRAVRASLLAASDGAEVRSKDRQGVSLLCRAFRPMVSP
jgi:hypothetical protein